MDEFDSLLDIADVPLHERIKNKFGGGEGGGGGINSEAIVIDDDDNDASISPSRPSSRSRPSSVLTLTPPPPFSPGARSPLSSPPPFRSDIRSEILKPVHNINPPALNKEKNAGKRKNENAKENQTKRRAKNDNAKTSKEYKEAEKIFNKQTDKTEVNKYILVSIDPQVVSSPPGAEILNLLTNPTSGKEEEIFQYRVENQRIPASITWKRRILYLDSPQDGGGGGQPRFHDHWIQEQKTLIFSVADRIAGKILDGTFDAWTRSVRQAAGGEAHGVTLVVYDYNAYLKVDKNLQERKKKAAVRGEQTNGSRERNSRLSEYEFQEALLSLSIDGVMDYLTFDKASDKGWKDCAGLVFHHTRAVAEAPEKLKKNISSSAGFEFYAKADVKDSVSSKNLYEYWKQVLMQVTSMSLEKASAIANKYPSPTSLLHAYRRCSSEREAELLLANIEIRRLDTIVGGTRRLGEEISRKIFHALVSDDPVSFLSK